MGPWFSFLITEVFSFSSHAYGISLTPPSSGPVSFHRDTYLCHDQGFCPAPFLLLNMGDKQGDSASQLLCFTKLPHNPFPYHVYFIKDQEKKVWWDNFADTVFFFSSPLPHLPPQNISNSLLRTFQVLCIPLPPGWLYGKHKQLFEDSLFISEFFIWKPEILVSVGEEKFPSPLQRFFWLVLWTKPAGDRWTGENQIQFHTYRRGSKTERWKELICHLS